MIKCAFVSVLNSKELIMPKFKFTGKENSTGWILAMSLRCPKCENRLWGNKMFAWCKSFDCNFFVPWDEIDKKCSIVNPKLKHNENFTKSEFEETPF